MSPVYRNENMALAAAVSIISTLSGRHLASPTGSTLNLYIAMIAKTGAGKNWPLKAPSAVFEALGYDYLTTGSFASAAALEAHLAQNPCVLACIDEIGNQLLARITNRKASSHERAIGGLVRELWSVDFGSHVGTAALTRGGAKRVSRPHFGIIGAARETEFYQALGSGNVDNGLFNRLTIIAAGPSKERDGDARLGELPPHALLNRLTAILPGGADGPLRAPKWVERPLVIPWADEDARECFVAFRREIQRRAENAPSLQAYTVRTAEQAVRLATIHAIGRDERNAAVMLDDMLWGVSFSTQSAETAIRGAVAHIVENEQQGKVRLIQNALETIWARKPVATRSELYRRLDGRLAPRDIDQIAEMLHEQKFLFLSSKKSSRQGGRPKTTYAKRLKIEGKAA